MINKEIIRIASNTSNVGLNNKYSHKISLKNNLCVNNNIKLPGYFIERFTSFWFHEYTKVGYLSYIQLGKYFTNNITNKFYNSLKTPYSFMLCPTILDI